MFKSVSGKGMFLERCIRKVVDVLDKEFRDLSRRIEALYQIPKFHNKCRLFPAQRFKSSENQ